MASLLESSTIYWLCRIETKSNENIWPFSRKIENFIIKTNNFFHRISLSVPHMILVRKSNNNNNNNTNSKYCCSPWWWWWCWSNKINYRTIHDVDKQSQIQSHKFYYLFWLRWEGSSTRKEEEENVTPFRVFAVENLAQLKKLFPRNFADEKSKFFFLPLFLCCVYREMFRDRARRQIEPVKSTT